MQVYVARYGFGSSIYFVSLIIFGNIMLLNLFLAILLNFISANLDDDDNDTDSDLGNDFDESVEKEFD